MRRGRAIGRRWGGALPRRAASRVLLASIVLLQGGCADGSGPAPGDGSDSALWTIADTPSVSFRGGTLDADSVFLWGLAYARFTPEGGVVAATRGGRDHRLLYFNAQGTLRSVVGRTGEGPGEFRTLSGLSVDDTTVTIWDQLNRRLSIYADLGARRADVPVPSHDPVVGLLPGGFVVTSPWSGGLASILERDSGPGTTDARHYDVWDEDWRQAAIIVGPPDPPSAYVRIEYEHPSGEYSPARLVDFSSTCLPATRHGTMGGWLVVADAASGTIYFRRPDNTGHEFRIEAFPPVTAEMRREALAWASAAASATAPGIRDPETRSSRPIPGLRMTTDVAAEILNRLGEAGDPMPSAWSAMMLDQSGRVWLRRPNCFTAASHATWQVVDTTGVLQGEVLVPETLRVLSASEDRLLGGFTDEWGVEWLGVFRIRRPEP